MCLIYFFLIWCSPDENFQAMTPNLTLKAPWTLRVNTVFVNLWWHQLTSNYWIYAVETESFNASRWRQTWRWKQHELYVSTLLLLIISDDTSLHQTRILPHHGHQTIELIQSRRKVSMRTNDAKHGVISSIVFGFRLLP